MRHGVLDGDLILVASGDLSLGGRTGPDGALLFADEDHTYAVHRQGGLVASNPLAGLDAIAADVASSGIKSVTGDIIIDDRLFEPASSSGSGPTRVTPIVINDNLIDFVITPAAAAGEPARVEMIPKTPYIYARRRRDHGPGEGRDVDFRRGPGRGVIVRGSVSLGADAGDRVARGRQARRFRPGAADRVADRHAVHVRASALGSNHKDRLPSRRRDGQSCRRWRNTRRRRSASTPR